MKNLREIVDEQIAEEEQPDLKHKILAVITIILLLYAAYHAVHLNFRFLTFLNEILSKILHFIYKYIVIIPADLFRGLWQNMI